MAEAHVVALRALGVEPVVVGRGRERAEELAERIGVEASWGGLDAFSAPMPDVAVIAVGPAELAGVASSLLERGCRAVLVEKPGALRSEDLERLHGRSRELGADVFVAYNRRFFPSVAAARQAIEEDGGPLSLHFEFTEIEERVTAGRGTADQVLARWGLVNSSHVVDLAFHLAGSPRQWVQQRRGALPWHPAGAVFSGSGETERGALFSYLATWSGAGRWSVEVTTAARKLILRPLEALSVQRKGSFEVEPVELDAEPSGLKPGLYGQLAAFLAAAAGEEPDPRLCSLEEALGILRAAQAIFGYS